MDVFARNNVHLAGSGPTTLVFVHGFGCDHPGAMDAFLAAIGA
jgi:hypothetical protein